MHFDDLAYLEVQAQFPFYVLRACCRLQVFWEASTENVVGHHCSFESLVLLLLRLTRTGCGICTRTEYNSFRPDLLFHTPPTLTRKLMRLNYFYTAHILRAPTAMPAAPLSIMRDMGQLAKTCLVTTRSLRAL